MVVAVMVVAVMAADMVVAGAGQAQGLSGAARLLAATRQVCLGTSRPSMAYKRLKGLDIAQDKMLEFAIPTLG